MSQLRMSRHWNEKGGECSPRYNLEPLSQTDPMTPKRKHTPGDINYYPGSFNAVVNEYKKPDIRSRPPKTDQELLEEYFALRPLESWIDCDCTFSEGEKAHTAGICSGMLKRKKLFEDALGPDKIRDERIRRLEERVKTVEDEKPSLSERFAAAMLGNVIGFGIVVLFYKLWAFLFS